MILRLPRLPSFAGLRALSETIGARAVGLVVSIVTLMLTARWLGPTGRGAIATLTTWSTIAATLASLSLGHICVHEARKAGNGDWMRPAISALSVFTIGASILCWAALATIFKVSEGSAIGDLPIGMLLVGFAIIPILIWEQFSSALITLSDQLRWYNFTQIAGKVATLGLATAMVLVLDQGVTGFLLAMLIGQGITTGAATMRLLARVGRLPRPSLSLLQRMVTNGLKLHLNVVGVLLITGVDVLMLQYFRGLAETGTFQLATQIFLTTLIVPQSAVLVLNGKVGALDPAGFWYEQRRMTALTLLLMTAGAAALALMAPLIIRTVASSSFDASIPVLQLLALAIPGATLNMMMGPQWLVRGWLLPASLITLAAGALNFSLNLLLIPQYGGIGAAWATLCGTYCIPIVTNLWLFRRCQREFRRV